MSARRRGPALPPQIAAVGPKFIPRFAFGLLAYFAPDDFTAMKRPPPGTQAFTSATRLPYAA